MTSSRANLISARTQFWDTHTSCSKSGYAMLELVTSMITARVTGLCRAGHRNRGTLVFPYVGPLFALGLRKRGYRSNVHKLTTWNQKQRRSCACLAFPLAKLYKCELIMKPLELKSSWIRFWKNSHAQQHSITLPVSRR